MFDSTRFPDSISHFMTALPFDIVSEIFSYLDQDDCLNSMAACRSWYDRVPIYSTQLWRKVQLETGDRRLKNQRFLRCLGPHVRKVVLTASSKNELSLFLDTLRNQSCEIQSIVFRRCKVVHQDVYQNALQPFAHTLRELSFEDHPYRVSPIHMMASCPNLTHYTYHFSDRPDYYTYSRVSSGVLPDTLQLPIKYLCLNTGSYSDFRLRSVLKHCPQLTCLIVNQSVPTTFDLDMCSRLCPELECLGFHGNSQGAKWESYARRRDTRRSRGLRHFISGEIGGYGARQMVPFLKKHERTLESIRIAGNYREYPIEEGWTGLKTIHATHLKSVHLTGLVLGSEPLGLFLHRSQGLNHVTLEYEQTDFDVNVAETLYKLPALRTLAIGVKRPRMLSSWTSDMTLGYGRLFGSRPFESVCLGGDLLDDPMIEVLDPRHVRSLELNQLECYDTPSLTADSIARLTGLEKLAFRNINSLTDSTLLSLSASMEGLKQLVLSGCDAITDAGLLPYVSGETNIQQLTIKNCASVSQGPHWNMKESRLLVSYE
ncbi:hypothetical protein BJV82DRAFT_718421 [Fennellomyces sp. T-0311]|nr:hypothetical protein BJV82DRAFT_718421 [Fennellomyces sp. T-0311]